MLTPRGWYRLLAVIFLILIAIAAYLFTHGKNSDAGTIVVILACLVAIATIVVGLSSGRKTEI